MRVFWSLMLVLFVASMGVFVRPEMPERVPTRGEQADIVRKPMTEPPVISREPLTRDEPSSLSPIEAAELPGAVRRESDAELSVSAELLEAYVLEDPEAPRAASDETGTEEYVAELVEEESPGQTEEEAEAPALDPFAAAAEAYLQRSRTETAQSVPDVRADINANAESPVASENTEAPTSQTEPEPEPETKAPASEQTQTAPILQPDGSLRIGNTVVTGDGSAARPYELDWPLLTSVARDYKPEKGMKELPEWLGLLEGKRVRLTGHVVLPLVATSTDELLLTMNPWDGCCVGVPPTPYDAMEVTTSEPISMQGASMYGTLEGTFRTDPYIAGGWLLGLYLLDDARVVK